MSMTPLIIVIFAVTTYVWYKFTSRDRPPLPPSPPGDPFIGHLRLIPPVGQETFFYNLGKIYGHVIHFSILGRSMIVLNSAQAAIDLLDKRSANYSDRPYLPIWELMGFEKSPVFTRYGKYFQMHRRMYQQYLSTKQSIAYHPIQSREACALIQHILKKPELREEYLLRYSTAIIMRIAYGHQITSDSDPYSRLAENVCTIAENSGSPGGSPVDLFPFLRYFPSWFPGTYYAKYARDARPKVIEAHNYPFVEVKKQMENRVAKPSFLASQLDRLKDEGTENPEMIEHIKAAAGTLYLAGAETTSSSLSHFFLAMVLHPECQTMAHEEIDRVIGSGRLPEFNDRPLLPYIECIVQETLRWNQAVPLGIPHRSLADDIYNGMFIPKDSIVIANTRAMTLDEDIYANPFQFNPARFLPKPKGLGEPYPIGVFGFGRRICPGRRLANDSLWIAIATILATLSISKSIDKDGKEIMPEISFISGITSHPKPFLCHLKPRSDVARSLITHMDSSDSY